MPQPGDNKRGQLVLPYYVHWLHRGHWASVVLGQLGALGTFQKSFPDRHSHSSLPSFVAQIFGYPADTKFLEIETNIQPRKPKDTYKMGT